jgi:signal transduction histidine kinase
LLFVKLGVPSWIQKMPYYRPPQQRPPWWPAEEAWPPQAPLWRRGRDRFFRRWRWLIGIWFWFNIIGCALGILAAGIALGWLNAPPLDPGMPMMRGLGMFWRMGGGLCLTGLIFAGGIGFIFVIITASRRVVRPLGDIMDAAGRVEAGDYGVRVPEEGSREVRDLARAFNSMTTRLQTNEEQRRRLLADVTHELRTPLTVMQGNLEAMLDGVYTRDDEHLEPILNETRVMSRLVEDLRTLSLAESGALKLHKEPTDLSILASETVASFQAQADGAGIILKADVSPELPLLDIDPVRIREVLANLIANSLRHTSAGGTIMITGSNGGGHVAMSVVDTGSGISAADLPHIFDRFYKSEGSRGMGLGLAIAKNLVAAHGGTITAQSESGRGTTIRFTLPNNS